MTDLMIVGFVWFLIGFMVSRSIYLKRELRDYNND